MDLEEQWNAIPNYLLTSDRVVDCPTPDWRDLPMPLLFRDDGALDVELLRDHLENEGRLEMVAILRLLYETREALSREPNLHRLKAPVLIVGDIHGQFYDLLSMFDECGWPPERRYLFLGDYVDRGSFGVETCLLLFALKLTFPDHVFLLRGNHETRILTMHFNFKRECEVKYGEDVYLAFMEVFDCLPLGATVSNSIGRFLCIHGGLSPNWKKVEELDEVNRFMEPPEFGLFNDVLWSDPAEEESTFEMTPEQMDEWRALTFVDNPTRGCGYIFGYSAVFPFCQENDLVSIIRGHEVQRAGFNLHRFGCESIERDFPFMVTVFSAPNYCDMYRNAGAILDLDEDSYDFRVFECVPHPFWFPRFANAFDVTLPLIMQKIGNMVTKAIEEIRAGDDEVPTSPYMERLRVLQEIESADPEQVLETIAEEDTATQEATLAALLDAEDEKQADLKQYEELSGHVKLPVVATPLEKTICRARASLAFIPPGIISQRLNAFARMETEKNDPRPKSGRARSHSIEQVVQMKVMMKSKKALETLQKKMEEGVTYDMAREKDHANEMRPPVSTLKEFWEEVSVQEKATPAPAPKATTGAATTKSQPVTITRSVRTVERSTAGQSSSSGGSKKVVVLSSRGSPSKPSPLADRK